MVSINYKWPTEDECILLFNEDATIQLRKPPLCRYLSRRPWHILGCFGLLTSAKGQIAKVSKTHFLHSEYPLLSLKSR